MAEQLFEVAFSGQIHDDAVLEDVKANIAEIFKADEATIAQLFSGRRMVIKKGMTAAAADKYSLAFTKAGAICELALMPEGSTPTAPSAAADKTARQTKSPASNAATKKVAARKPGARKVAVICAIVVVIVGALVAAMPFATGILAEQKYREGMAIFEEFAVQQSGAFNVTSDVDYQRGWLSSTALNTIILEAEESDSITLVLNSTISHGPLLLDGPARFGIASVETNMPLSEAQRADMARIWQGNDNPIQIQSHIAFDGKTVTGISIAGFTLDELDDHPASQLNFEPLTTTVTLSEQFTRADADMAWNGMQLSTAEAKVVVGKFTAYSTKQLSPQGLWLGDDELSLSSLNIEVRGALLDDSGQMPASSTIDNIKMTAHSEVDSDNLVKGDTTITVKDVIVGGESVAKKLRLSLAVERLQAQALQAIAEKMSEHQKRSIQSGNPGQAPDLSMLQSEITAILGAGPVLKISTLQATTAHGKVDADLEATIKVDDPAMLQNPMFLLLAIQAAGNVSIPARLLENTPVAAFAPGFIEQGYIKNENGQLMTSIKFQQGQLTLNTKPLQM